MPKILVKCSEFPYGKISANLKKAAKWINSHKCSIKKNFQDYFDYPDYWGMPFSISHNLSPDEVDFIQNQTYHFTKEIIDYHNGLEKEKQEKALKEEHDNGKKVWIIFQNSLGRLDNSMGDYNYLIGKYILNHCNFNEKHFIQTIKKYLKEK